MAIKYVFDTNVLINLQRRQPIDIYPSLWEMIGDLLENKIIISSREVFDEITCSDDDLAKWAKKRIEYFMISDIIIQQKVRNILNEHRGLVEGGKKKNNADPFIIAIALGNNLTIVTEEIKSNNMNSPKIPDICEVYGIKHIGFVDFSREMKFAF